MRLPLPENSASLPSGFRIWTRTCPADRVEHQDAVAPGPQIGVADALDARRRERRREVAALDDEVRVPGRLPLLEPHPAEDTGRQCVPAAAPSRMTAASTAHTSPKPITIGHVVGRPAHQCEAGEQGDPDQPHAADRVRPGAAGSGRRRGRRGAAPSRACPAGARPRRPSPIIHTAQPVTSPPRPPMSTATAAVNGAAAARMTSASRASRTASCSRRPDHARPAISAGDRGGVAVAGDEPDVGHPPHPGALALGVAARAHGQAPLASERSIPPSSRSVTSWRPWMRSAVVENVVPARRRPHLVHHAAVEHRRRAAVDPAGGLRGHVEPDHERRVACVGRPEPALGGESPRRRAARARARPGGDRSGARRRRRPDRLPRAGMRRLRALAVVELLEAGPVGGRHLRRQRHVGERRAQVEAAPAAHDRRAAAAPGRRRRRRGRALRTPPRSPRARSPIPPPGGAARGRRRRPPAGSSGSAGRGRAASRRTRRSRRRSARPARARPRSCRTPSARRWPRPPPRSRPRRGRPGALRASARSTP